MAFNTLSRFKSPFFMLSLLFSFGLCPGLWADEIAVDDLSKDKAVGGFPSAWQTFPFQGGKAKQVYKVEEETGKRFIRAYDNQDLSVRIMNDFLWPLSKYPKISWRWRARELPKGAAENKRETNDSACGVYVAFGKTSGVALKYVWSSTLPVGHVWEKDPGKFYIIVASSGAAKLNQWQNIQVNVLEDYKKYFKKDPSKDPSGIGLLTDGNAMHSPAACDYGDFAISN